MWNSQILMFAGLAHNLSSCIQFFSSHILKVHIFAAGTEQAFSCETLLQKSFLMTTACASFDTFGWGYYCIGRQGFELHMKAVIKIPCCPVPTTMRTFKTSRLLSLRSLHSLLCRNTRPASVLPPFSRRPLNLVHELSHYCSSCCISP